MLPGETGRVVAMFYQGDFDKIDIQYDQHLAILLNVFTAFLERFSIDSCVVVMLHLV